MNEPSLVARNFHSCSKLTDATPKSTDGFFCSVAVTERSSSTFSSSGTDHGSCSIGTCQNSSYFGTGASWTSRFFATALAFATSVAIAVTRVISSGDTFGLLAKPQTPLWMTRTPKPYVSVASPPPNPPPPRRIRPLRTAIDCARLRVKRMSAYEQPSRLASPSATVDHSRYFGSRTAGACSRAGSNVRANANRGTLAATAPAPSDCRNLRREGLIRFEYKLF